MIRVWEAATGEALTCIEPPADVNDVALYSDSGLLFAALEAEKLGVYFVPALGPAPRWCHFIDALSEEMEEQATGALYDDYKFVRREELIAPRLLVTSVLQCEPAMPRILVQARVATHYAPSDVVEVVPRDAVTNEAQLAPAECCSKRLVCQ